MLLKKFCTLFCVAAISFAFVGCDAGEEDLGTEVGDEMGDGGLAIRAGDANQF